MELEYLLGGGPAQGATSSSFHAAILRSDVPPEIPTMQILLATFVKKSDAN